MAKKLTVEDVERIADKLRALPPAEKAIAKTERERLRLERQAAKVQRELNRLSEIKYKQAKRRHFLPSVFPSSADSEKSDYSLGIGPDGFGLEQTEGCHSSLCEALCRETFPAILDALAEMFQCDRLEVVIVEAKSVRRQGKDVNFVCMRYGFNQEANGEIKAIPNSWFDRNETMAWYVRVEPYNLRLLWGIFKKYFAVIVDVNAVCAFINLEGAERAVTTRAAFQLLPAFVNWSVEDVFKAIRVETEDSPENIYVHDGASFVRPEIESASTNIPFLLCRYAVGNGRPRYVAYSVLGRCVETVSFGNGDKTTRRMIARYGDTLRLIKQGRWNEMPLSEGVQLCDWNRFRGDFYRFQQEILHVNSRVDGIEVTLLCSDYVSMAEMGHGSDTASANVLAYVLPFGKEYLSRIAEFFGDESGGFPVVVDRGYLDDLWRRNNPSIFYDLMAHEVAHYLVASVFGGGRQAHGVEWAIIADLLCYLFSEDFEYSLTELVNYSDDKVLCSVVENEILSCGIPHLQSVAATRWVKREDVAVAARIVMSSVVDAMHSRQA